MATGCTGCHGDGESDGGDAGDNDCPIGPCSNDIPAVNMCDIWSPDDCADGEKCNAYATIVPGPWDGNRCVMIVGDGQPGDDCMGLGTNPGVSGEDDCDKGGICWSIDDDTMIGYCVAFCTGSPSDPMCGDGSICGIYNNGVLPLCLPTCDPLQAGADCVDTDNPCVFYPSGNGFICTLGSAGTGAYGSACQFANACNQGLFCADPDAVLNCQGSLGCCSEFCDVNEPNTCAGMGEGQECVPWDWGGPAPDEWAHVGGCAIP